MWKTDWTLMSFKRTLKMKRRYDYDLVHHTIVHSLFSFITLILTSHYDSF